MSTYIHISHIDFKPEKIAHKDLWTKFLSGEDHTIRDVFESEFEEKLLMTGEELMTERVKRQPLTFTDYACHAIDKNVSYLEQNM
jgi:hypothetical protein